MMYNRYPLVFETRPAHAHSAKRLSRDLQEEISTEYKSMSGLGEGYFMLQLPELRNPYFCPAIRKP